MNPSELRLSSRSELLRHIILPLGDRIVGQGMMKRLRFLEAAQWWDRDRLYAHRNAALRSLMRIAYYQVPFYRDLMDHARVMPDEIQNPDDLGKLPVVTKDMLRAGYPHLTTRSTRSRTYEASSSGSTGQNFLVREDAETAGWYRASFILALEWAGWKLGEPQLQMGMTLARSLDRRLKDTLLQCHYVSAFDLSDPALDRVLELLDKRKIGHLWGYPGSLFFLAKRALATGWNQPLRSVVTWGDNLYPHYRQLIEKVFRTRIVDTYGCGEGFQIAAQCEEVSYYHIHTLDVIVEYLDEDGNPVDSDQPGHVVVTRLHPGPMPLIRYRVGDICTPAGPRTCSCGRGFDLMSGIQGRDTDVITTPSGNRLIVHFFTGVLEHFQEVDSFQVIQDEPDRILLRLVPAPHFAADVPSKIRALLQERGALDTTIDIELVDEIPLPASGKRRFVVSKIRETRN